MRYCWTTDKWTKLDVHFISSSPVELQPVYMVEEGTRPGQNVEGGG